MKKGKTPSEISSDYNLTKILKLVEITEYEAYPDPSLKDKTAPWIIVPKGTQPSSITAAKNPMTFVMV